MKYLVFVPGLERPVFVEAEKYVIRENVIEFSVFDERASTPQRYHQSYQTVAVFNLNTIAGFMEDNT